MIAMVRRLATLGNSTRDYLRRNPQIPQTIAAVAIKSVGAVLSFGFTFLLAHQYGPAGVGQFGLAVTTLVFASTVALMGTDYVLIRTVAGDLRTNRRDLARGAISTVPVMVMITSSVTAVALAISIVPALSRLYYSPSDGLLLRSVIFGVIPMASMRIVSSALRSSGRVLFAQIIDGPASIALAIAAVLLLRFTAGETTVVSAGIAYFAAIAACAALGGVVQWRDLRHWPKIRVPIRPLLMQGLPIMFAVLSGFAVDWLILTILATNHSAAAVGIFRTAWQVANIFNIIIISFDSVAMPRIAAAYRIGDLSSIARTWRQAVAIIFMLASPLFVITLVFPGQLLGLFGIGFDTGVTVLRILVAAQIINVLTGPIGSILIMMGGERYVVINSLFALCFAALSAMVLIPPYGVTGAAIASALTLAIRNLFSWLIVSFKLGIPLIKG
jgi:O-antigen/teichoic acid export membrane protein